MPYTFHKALQNRLLSRWIILISSAQSARAGSHGIGNSHSDPLNNWFSLLPTQKKLPLYTTTVSLSSHSLRHFSLRIIFLKILLSWFIPISYVIFIRSLVTFEGPAVLLFFIFFSALKTSSTVTFVKGPSTISTSSV